MSEVTFGGNTIGDKALYLKGIERGKKEERERIIKLLESEPSEKWFFVGFRQHLIALIKGEKENK